uniref:Uncharacterized protein n=1 Tax=Arundo donax TaxID=35708 RepID=A0A0A9AQG5_ARUDO
MYPIPLVGITESDTVKEKDKRETKNSTPPLCYSYSKPPDSGRVD